MKKNTEISDQLFYREFALTREALNKEKREITLSFSSEEPVMRWFGAEILLHGNRNVDLNRLNQTGSLIYGHQPNELKNILGPIKSAWLDESLRKCRALVGFDNDKESEQSFQKVKSGSLKGVSCGYSIKKARKLTEGEEWRDPDGGKKFKGPAMIATLWEPIEISLTPVPADTKVGIGRAAERSLDGIEIELEKSLDRDDIASIVSVLSFENRSNVNQGKIQITLDQLQDFTARAAAVSDKMLIRVIDKALEGATGLELERTIIGGLYEHPDAKDSGGCDKEDARRGGKTYSTISDMPDDVFINSLK